MQTEIKNEWVYDQAPNEVWEYLTQADLIALWLMPNNFKAIEGQEFQFTTNKIPSLELDGIMHCKVLELIPHKKLVYSWKAGPGDGSFTLDTVVEWKLEAYGKGTKLHLRQTGFKEANAAIFAGMTEGWKSHVLKMMNLPNTIENGNPGCISSDC